MCSGTKGVMNTGVPMPIQDALQKLRQYGFQECTKEVRSQRERECLSLSRESRSSTILVIKAHQQSVLDPLFRGVGSMCFLRGSQTGSCTLAVLIDGIHPPRNQCGTALRNVSPKKLSLAHPGDYALSSQPSSRRFLFRAEHYSCARAPKAGQSQSAH